jgi:hypothetical protein
MDVSKKITDGAYKPRTPYPSKSIPREKFVEERRKWHSELSRLEQEFKRDALEECGILGHPKADLAYAKAWDRGHSSGLHEVLYELQDLAELIR